jgi:hypothetical protein
MRFNFILPLSMYCISASSPRKRPRSPEFVESTEKQTRGGAPKKQKSEALIPPGAGPHGLPLDFGLAAGSPGNAGQNRSPPGTPGFAEGTTPENKAPGTGSSKYRRRT